MWLLQQIVKEQKGALSEQGNVIKSNETSVGVNATTTHNDIPLYGPYGYESIPPKQEDVLLVPCQGESVCAGVKMPSSSLKAGEIRICSQGGTEIILKNNGDIYFGVARLTKEGILYVKKVVEEEER